MPAMIGGTLRKVVAFLLFVGFCTIASEVAAHAPEPRQDQAEPRDIEALRLAAEQGDAEAQADLGVMYRDGKGIPQDAVEATRWFRLAADQGNRGAQVNLGVMYLRGEGTSQDVVQAAMWHYLAAERGFPPAEANVPGIEAQMTAEQIAEAQRLARDWTPTTPE